jgi:hypothetical protein
MVATPTESDGVLLARSSPGEFRAGHDRVKQSQARSTCANPLTPVFAGSFGTEHYWHGFGGQYVCRIGGAPTPTAIPKPIPSMPQLAAASASAGLLTGFICCRPLTLDLIRPSCLRLSGQS